MKRFGTYKASVDSEYRASLERDKKDLKEKEQRILELEQKNIAREERIDRRFEEIEKKFETLREKEQSLDEAILRQERDAEALRTELSRVSNLSESEARELLLKRTEERFESDILGLLEKKKKDLHVREAEIAREIIIKSIQQYA